MRHTQNTSYNGRPVIVAAGWDNRMNGYFMTVEPVHDNNPDADAETGMIYSNLDDEVLSKSHGMSDNIDHYKTRLHEMNIEIPGAFFAKVLAD